MFVLNVTKQNYCAGAPVRNICSGLCVFPLTLGGLCPSVTRVAVFGEANYARETL